MDSSEEKLKTLRTEQEVLSRKLSFLTFETIVIFGVPAILGYFVGVYGENKGFPKAIAYIIPLVITFVLSWVILLKKLKGISEKVKNVEAKIRQLVPPKVQVNKDELDEEGDLK